MLPSQVYFPFEKVRPFQDELIKDVCLALSERKHLVCHAPTGLGKTVSALAPAISFALKENKSVFFLSPKTSQHELAVEVVKGLSKKFGLNLRGIDLVGKRYMCSDPMVSSTGFDGFYEVCSKKVKHEQCVYYGNAVGFSKEEKSVSQLYLDVLSKASLPVLNNYDFKNMAVSMTGRNGERPMCAYEASMQIGKESNVVICDYFHVLNPGVSKITLNRLNKKLSDSILIVDEAHNLPDRLRKLMSSTLSSLSITQAAKEAKILNDDILYDKLIFLRRLLKSIAKKYLSEKNREALVSVDDFSIDLQKEISDVDEFIGVLRSKSVEYLERSNRSKSRLVPIANFLEKWDEEGRNFVRIIKKFGAEDDFSLSVHCLDSALLMSQVFKESYSTILMSGTLLPTTMYADLFGVEKERTILREYPSPFPKENRLNLIVPGVTTKFANRNTEQFSKIASVVANVLNVTPGNSVVFFPSFALLEQVNFFLKPLVKREVLIQKAFMTPSEKTTQLQRFKTAGKKFGAVLLGVASGSYAEGLDFPGSELLCAIVVGVPLPEPNLYTKCLIDFFEEKYSKGWHYAYLYPSISKAIQASGRVIRSESDLGVTVFLDERYTWQNYSSCFPKDFTSIQTTEPEKFAKEFWQRGET